MRPTHGFGRLSGLALGLAVCAAPIAWSAENVVVAGKAAARITAAGNSGSVAQRAAEIDKNITQAISVEDVGSPRMSVRVAGGVPAIYVGGTFLLSVLPADAKAYGTSPDKLAQQWVANFKRLFPLAEPCTHMGAGAAGGELARAQARAAASANVTVPAADWAIVGVVLDHLAAARKLDAAAWEAQMAAAVEGLHADIVRNLALRGPGRALLPAPPHAPGKCPQAGGCQACKAAQAAALGDGTFPPMPPAAWSPAVTARIGGGLKLVRRVDEARFLRDRVMIAWTLVKAVRVEADKNWH